MMKTILEGEKLINNEMPEKKEEKLSLLDENLEDEMNMLLSLKKN